jgi:hypothetical protein
MRDLRREVSSAAVLRFRKVALSEDEIRVTLADVMTIRMGDYGLLQRLDECSGRDDVALALLDERRNRCADCQCRIGQEDFENLIHGRGRHSLCGCPRYIPQLQKK